jgi:hypothetical protein
MNNLFKLIGIIALGIFALIVGLPLLLAAAGIVLGSIGMAIGLAIALLKLAVIAAIGYLILVGVRALLR